VVLALLTGVAALLLARRPGRVGTAVPTPATAPAAGVSQARRAPRAIAGALAFALGAYDGFFGPGVGTLLIMGFVLLLGVPMTQASGDAKVVNFASNLAALVVFAQRGAVVWSVALPMAAAALIGGSLGAKLALRGGDRVVRWVVLAVALALVGKLALELATGR
jgi:uncharacterized membrane protein YfcA